MTRHMDAVSLTEHQRVLSMASGFADRAERAEAAIQRVRDVYYGPVGLLDTRIQQIGDILRALDGDGDA